MTKIKGNFIMIPDKYWVMGLDIYETNILARIMSWQRRNERFFESYESIAIKFNMHKNTAKNKFESLEKQGLIKRGPKVKRAWSWKADELAISNLIDSNKRCNNNDRKEQEMSQLVTRDVSYKNPKNNNKIILREEEEKRSSPPQPEVKDEITDIALHQFMNQVI